MYMYVQSYDLLKKEKENLMGYNCHIKTQVTNLEVLTNHYKHKFPWTVVWDKKKIECLLCLYKIKTFLFGTYKHDRIT